MLKRTLVAAIVLAAAPAGAALAQSRPECTLFEHDRFQGRQISLRDGDAVSFRSGQFWNDRASSVSVARGCLLIAYQHTRMGGDAIEIDGRIHSLKRIGWNDRISSAECDCGAY